MTQKHEIDADLWLSELRKRLLEVIEQIVTSNDIRKGILYVLRSQGRFKKKEEKIAIYEAIFELFRMYGELYTRSTLLDSIDLIDYLTGGVRK